MESLPTVNPADHEFSVPVKKIMEGDTLKEFQESDTYKEILMFIALLQKSVQGTKMTTTEVPECLIPLYELLNKYEGFIDEIPPVEQPMRFGNKAFKSWLDKLKENYEEDMKTILPTEDLQRAIPELYPYLTEAFGHYERIGKFPVIKSLDYGTGHELSFLGFMM